MREVRCGTGALAAVQLENPADAPRLVGLLREEGVATRAVGVGGIQISPAFIMTDAEVDSEGLAGSDDSSATTGCVVVLGVVVGVAFAVVPG